MFIIIAATIFFVLVYILLDMYNNHIENHDAEHFYNKNTEHFYNNYNRHNYYYNRHHYYNNRHHYNPTRNIAYNVGNCLFCPNDGLCYTSDRCHREKLDFLFMVKNNPNVFGRNYPIPRNIPRLKNNHYI